MHFAISVLSSVVVFVVVFCLIKKEAFRHGPLDGMINRRHERSAKMGLLGRKDFIVLSENKQMYSKEICPPSLKLRLL